MGDKGVLDVTKLGLSELSMRVRVGRNLTQFNLPGAMDKSERIEFEKAMLKAFDKLKKDPAYGGTVYSLSPVILALNETIRGIVDERARRRRRFTPSTWTRCDRDALPRRRDAIDAVPRRTSATARRTRTSSRRRSTRKASERHRRDVCSIYARSVMFKDMAADTYLASAGIADDWPYGRGCWQSDDKQCIVWFGEEDQLRIMCMKRGTKLNEVFDRLKKMLDTIESIDGITFATSSKYGYVTSCPSI